MAHRNCNVTGEIEPRVPRHPTAAPTETVPTVPEVSLAFDTPQQRNPFPNEPRSSTLPTSYAQWKQQVPHQPTYNNKIDGGMVQRISRSNSSSETSRKPTAALAIIERPQNLPPSTFTRDSRLKFYQKIGPESSPAESKILPMNNPLKSPPRRRQRSLPVASRPQEPSDVVLKEKLEVSSNPQDRVDRIKNTCDCHSHNSENTDIINKLLSLVQSQNAQIQMLQGQVETLLSIRTERPRELNDYQRLPLPAHNVATNTIDPALQNPCLQYPKSPREIQEFEEKQRDDKCKQLIKEKKVSIGVMTSFELTVQDSVVYNVDAVPTPTDYQEKSPHSEGNKNLGSRTPVAVGKIPNGPLEQIIEDSESHLSSTVQASNNFHTVSSARKSLQGNFQGDLSTCVELPQINRQQSPVVPLSQTNRVGIETRPHKQPDVASGQKRFSSGDNHSPNQQKYSPTSRVAPSNLRTDSPPEDVESVKKTPKVGWTLYDNVMCQVNEILHNTQEERVEKRQEIVQETNGPKLLLNGIQQSTVEQLKLFGFTFADTSGCSEGRSLVDGRRMNPIPIDASYYPRLDYQANVIQTSGSVSDSNTSMHMKALAMKYLGTKQLPNVSSHQRGMELFTSMVLSNIQNNMPGASGNEVPKFDNNRRFQGSPKALPDCQRENYLIHSKQTPPNSHNILDMSSLKRQPKLL
ncbi:uncharacterized protein LOC107041675 [Diachasma alloeum]|uniref:uncharacterized protein LOC107041675 n=1 Tax=Diachasma alloeum TaxID=454923 RepID=UPI0007383269|nr:uncharacterized protein LOC107041675 [Diachasma alloeum]